MIEERGVRARDVYIRCSCPDTWAYGRTVDYMEEIRWRDIIRPRWCINKNLKR